MYDIEKDVPCEQPKRRTDRYPWGSMGVGDSFFVSSSDAKANSVSNAVWHANNKHFPKRYITRRFEDGVRVWREK